MVNLGGRGYDITLIEKGGHKFLYGGIMELVNLGGKDYDITFIEKGGHSFSIHLHSSYYMELVNLGGKDYDITFIRSSMT